jgi:hypothetical protein
VRPKTSCLLRRVRHQLAFPKAALYATADEGQMQQARAAGRRHCRWGGAQQWHSASVVQQPARRHAHTRRRQRVLAPGCHDMCVHAAVIEKVWTGLTGAL